MSFSDGKWDDSATATAPPPVAQDAPGPARKGAPESALQRAFEFFRMPGASLGAMARDVQEGHGPFHYTDSTRPDRDTSHLADYWRSVHKDGWAPANEEYYATGNKNLAALRDHADRGAIGTAADAALEHPYLTGAVTFAGEMLNPLNKLMPLGPVAGTAMKLARRVPQIDAAARAGGDAFKSALAPVNRFYQANKIGGDQFESLARRLKQNYSKAAKSVFGETMGLYGGLTRDEQILANRARQGGVPPPRIVFNHAEGASEPSRGIEIQPLNETTFAKQPLLNKYGTLEDYLKEVEKPENLGYRPTHMEVDPNGKLMGMGDARSFEEYYNNPWRRQFWRPVDDFKSPEALAHQAEVYDQPIGVIGRKPIGGPLNLSSGPAARAPMIHDAISDRAQRLVKKFPNLADKMFEEPDSPNFLPMRGAWDASGKDPLTTSATEVVPRGTGGRNPVGGGHKRVGTIAEGEDMGLKLSDDYVPAEAHYQDALKKESLLGRDDLFRELDGIKDKNGTPLMAPFKYYLDQGGNRLSWQGPAEALKYARREAAPLARRSAFDAAEEGKVGPQAAGMQGPASPREIEAYARSLRPGIAKDIFAKTEHVAGEDHVPNAREALGVSGIGKHWSDRFSIHNEAYKIFTEAKAPEAEATGYARWLDNLNRIARVGIIYNPVIHVAWNLSNHYLAAGGSPAFLGKGVWQDPDPHWLARAQKTSAVPEMSPGTFGIGQGTHGSIASIATRPMEDLAPRERLDKALTFGTTNKAAKIGVGAAIGAGVGYSVAPEDQRAQGAAIGAGAGGGIGAAVKRLPGWVDNSNVVFDKFEKRFAVDLFRRKVENEGMSDAQAGIAVRKALSDYDNIDANKYEKAFHQAAFFYPWLKTTVPFWARMMVEKPGTINAPMSGIRAANEVQGDTGSPDDAFPRKPFSLTVGHGKDGSFTRVALPFPQRIAGDLAGIALGAGDKTKNALYDRMTPIADVARQHLNPVASTAIDLIAPGNRFQRVQTDPLSPPLAQAGQAVGDVARRFVPPVESIQRFGDNPLGTTLGTAFGGYVSTRKSPQQRARETSTRQAFSEAIHAARARGDWQRASDLYDRLQRMLTPTPG